MFHCSVSISIMQRLCAANDLDISFDHTEIFQTLVPTRAFLLCQPILHSAYPSRPLAPIRKPSVPFFSRNCTGSPARAYPITGIPPASSEWSTCQGYNTCTYHVPRRRFSLHTVWPVRPGLSVPWTVGQLRSLIGPAICAIHWDPSHP